MVIVGGVGGVVVVVVVVGSISFVELAEDVVLFITETHLKKFIPFV